MLDSQRAAKADEKGKKKKPLGKRKRNRGMASAEEPGERKQSNAPILALAASVILLLVIAVAVALNSGGDEPQRANPDTPSDSPSVPADEPQVADRPQDRPPERPKPKDEPSKDRSKWSAKEKSREAVRLAETIVVDADDLLASGKTDEAIAKLNEFPADLRDQPAYKDVEKLLKKAEKIAPEQKRLAGVLAQAKGGDLEPLKKTVREILSEKYPFSGAAFLNLFREEARELLGEEQFLALKSEAEIADMGSVDYDDSEEAALGDGIDFEMEVEMRGTPERHAAFVGRKSEFEGNLRQAEQRLADRRNARLKELRVQAERAKKKAKNLKINGKACTLVDLTEKGFMIEVSGRRIEFGWGNAPAKLGHAVKSAAVDPQSADEAYELGMYALKRALFDEAVRDFQRAGKLGSQHKVPNIDELKLMVQLFRGQSDYRDGKQGESTVSWDMTQDAQKNDFTVLHQAMKLDLGGGKLAIQTPQNFLLTAANVQGAWDERATLEMKVGTTSPAPAVWFKTEAGQYLVHFGSQTQLFASAVGRGAAVASSGTKAGQGDTVSVSVTQSGDKATVSVSVGGSKCFEKTVPGEGEITFMVGCKGSGRVEIGPIKVSGQVSAKWARRTLASAPSRLARELTKFEAQLQSGNEQQMAMPTVLRGTSAEDQVALEGIPAEQVEALKNARVLFAQGNQFGALKKLEEASQNPLFHAANFTLAALRVKQDPAGSLIRLDRAVKGVQDFYEAKVARASALFWLSKYDECRKELDEALKLRPDYGPAYLVKANLQVHEGDYDTALQTLALSEELAPGDPFTLSTRGRVVALAEGPNWFTRKTATTGHYALSTDMVDYAEQFVKQLESIRRRYEEAFPLLMEGVADPGQASVLIFSEAEGYYQYSERTGVGRAENTLGHFNPWSGQLLLFLEEDPDDWNSFHVIFHEGMHQWCHAAGLELPFWANEGMAEYVGGTRLSEDGKSIQERGAIDSFLKKRLINLTSNWNERLDFFDIARQSPQEFYAGNAPLKYAQAWTMVHFFMESGHPGVKEKFISYLKAYKALESAEDKKSAQEGSKMQYIWNDTLGQLDAVETKKAWEKYVEKLAKRAKLNWRAP